MTKFFKRIATALLVAFAWPMMAVAQPLPVDPDVRIDKLDNGIVYYIRHNETPKGQASFYIAQKVGSILEEENQRGLAHFLEHMCFNGTENFPGNSLIDYLESIGVKFGQNLNAYTSIDETVYNISNVPTARKSVQDSVLLVLHDWADGLLLDPEEIDKERGVIHQEWRRSMQGQMRILENILPVMFPDSKYGTCLPIGTMEVVDNFPPQVLRDYYEAWYRPDQQGIVVVGDIDVDYIEGKIKEIFSPIQMPANPKERIYAEVDDNDGTIYALGSDPEMQSAIISINFKNDPVPNEFKGELNYLVLQYMISMAENMLSNRLDEIAQKPDAPYAQAGVSYGDFLVTKTKEAFDLSVVAKGDDILPGLEAAYRELLRAVRGGFTVGEYDRTRSEYLSSLEKKYNGRDKRQSEEFVNAYVLNFIDNEPIPSIEQRYEILNAIAPQITVEMINSILPDLINDDNRVLMGLFPKNDKFQIPTQEQIAAVIAKVDAEDIEPYQDAMREDPLIPELPTPGKVVSVTDDTQWDAKVLTLSNGVKVVVKTTDLKKDEILFDALALGGTSIVSQNRAVDLVVTPYAMSTYGLGLYNNTDMQKYLQGKQAELDLNLSDYTREFEGQTTLKDLPTLMELIYMYFTAFNVTEDDFSAMQNRLASLIENQMSNPTFVFQSNVQKALYEAASHQLPTPETIKAANREDVLDIVRSMTNNAADYTFYFVGDVTVEQITPLLEQYIATLPADVNKVTNTVVTDPSLEIRAGSGTDTNTMKMETPQTWVAIVVEGSIPYTPKSKMISSIAPQILSNRLLKKIREEMGAVYSIGAGGTMTRSGIYNTLIQIPFPMKPELKDEVLNEISSMLNGMTENITADELNPIKEFLVKESNESLEKNSGWLNNMVAASINGVDTMHGRNEVINAITTEDVQNFMKELLDQGNYRIVILDPEQ